MLFSWLQRSPRLKRSLRGLVNTGLRCMPAQAGYRSRGMIERFVYRHAGGSAELPPIFHHWSNTFLLPKLRAAGCESPDDFFLKEVQAHGRSRPGMLRCLSIASGHCELEIKLARQLSDSGRQDFLVHCVDLNPEILAAARARAKAAGVADRMLFSVLDLNRAERPGEPFDVVIANQCLHHLVELESTMEFVKGALNGDGIFLTSDTIGRNGHQLWPEAFEVVGALWADLPDRLKRDRNRGGVARTYVDYDHSNTGFEGIRAQDILPLLVEHFDFQKVLFYGCIIFPFIERRFGWNYDVASDADRAIIERVARLDEELLEAGRVKPTQILARMTRKTGMPIDPGVDAANALARRAIRPVESTAVPRCH